MPESDFYLQLIRDSFAHYCLALYPGYELAKHLRYVIDKLEAVERGEITRLVLNMPPRHGKTLTVSKLFPAWYLGRHPRNGIIEAAYGQDLASDYGREVRNFVQSPVHQAAFPACLLSEDTKAKHAFATSLGGTFYAVGRGGPITGRGANLIIIDDPLKGDAEAASPAIRDGLKKWYSDIIYTRQHGRGAIVIVCTRWHVDDLVGWVLREHKHENWTVINLPAIAEHNDLLARAEGEVLWPEKFSRETLENIRLTETSASWISLYQQRPTVGTGFLFKREWLENHLYDPDTQALEWRAMNRVILVDPANSLKRTSDYTCMFVLGFSRDRNFYILDMVYDRLTLRERADALFALHKKWQQPEEVGYEQYGMNADIAHLEDKQDRENYHFHIQPLAGNVAKPDRIARLEPLFRQGRIWMPLSIMRANRDGALEDLTHKFIEEEFVQYVSGGGGVAHDDGLDALSRLLDVTIDFPDSGGDDFGISEFYKMRDKHRVGGASAWSA